MVKLFREQILFFISKYIAKGQRLTSSQNLNALHFLFMYHRIIIEKISSLFTLLTNPLKKFNI